MRRNSNNQKTQQTSDTWYEQPFTEETHSANNMWNDAQPCHMLKKCVKATMGYYFHFIKWGRKTTLITLSAGEGKENRADPDFT